MSEPPRIPDPAVVVLVGASGSGKSTWAGQHYRATEIVSSDQLRGVVGSGPADLEASVAAFQILDAIVAARVGRGLTTVVDTLGLEPERRRGYLDLARSKGLPAVAVTFPTDPATCRARNAARDRPVPAPALAAQLRRMRPAADEIHSEGWDLVIESPSLNESVAATVERSATPTAAAPKAPNATTSGTKQPQLSFVLQISRFPWGEDPAGWLRAIARSAEQAGFEGLALMDHLIQIPQVGRAWDPIPEPLVTLGFLAGAVDRLTLGTLVSPVTFRPPGIVAKSIATLDVLSGGRAFCGLGAGWWEREHRAFGLGFPSARDRLDGLESEIETIRALWAPGTKAFNGLRVALPETTCYPRPAGSVPIIVGGGGERRTLRIAARLADACNLPSDPAVLDLKLPILRQHCREVGRDPQELGITVLDVPVVGSDREGVAITIEKLRGRTAATAFVKRHPAGTAPEHIVRYRGLVERGVQTVFLALPDLAGPDQVETCAPITSAFR